MKVFHFTKIRTPGSKNLKFFLFSDLHFSNIFPDEIFKQLLQKIKTEQADYILFAGDLVDCLGEIDSQNQETRLLSFLKKLAKIAPVLAIPGNHDFYRHDPAKPRKFLANDWLIDRKPVFFEKLRKIENFHWLENANFEDQNIFVLGLSPRPEYYNFSSSLDPNHKKGEKPEILQKDLQNLPENYHKNLPKNKTKIALIHSPIHLNRQKIKSQLTEFDFIISGHMHNGAVPPFLNEIWRSDRGLVAPGKGLFPKNARFYKNPKKLEQKPRQITLGAITTIHKCAKPLTPLNTAFPVNIATLKISKTHQNPSQSSKYLSF